MIGDFLLSDQSRFGQTPLETFLGPTFGAAADMTKLLWGDARKYIHGDKVNIGRDVISLGLSRYVPVLPSLWYTRAAYRRMFLDQLQYHIDPEAQQHFRQQEQRLHRETGQGYFWKPGETLPDRPPTLAEQQMTHYR